MPVAAHDDNIKATKKIAGPGRIRTPDPRLDQAD